MADSNLYQPRHPVPGKPIVTGYPTPDFNDRIFKVRKDSRASDYKLPTKGDAFAGPEKDKLKDFLFAVSIPSDQIGWVDWVYVNERLNEDAYNFTIEYPWEDENYPRYTRTYVLLRSKVEKPNPDDTDPANDLCLLVDFKISRLEDPALDTLFVGLTKVFERITARTEVLLDRADSVLPFNMRTAVPAETITSVMQGAAGDAPEIVNEEDWQIVDHTDTSFRRTRKRTKRVIPNGSQMLDKGQVLTNEQQLGQRREIWAVGPQTITPRATIIKSSVEDIGNNTTVKDEIEVDRVFPAIEFTKQIDDFVPREFQDLFPTETVDETSAGNAAMPDLLPGELKRTSRQTTDLQHREGVVRRDLTGLPKTITDQELDGIQARGSEFGGIYDIDKTLALGEQSVEEGFEIMKSSVRHIGGGLTLRETKRLSTVQGAHLLLTDAGHDYECDPAVEFSGGNVGSGAEAEPTISPIGAGGGSEDQGGVFPLTFSSVGDENGIFNFLAKRYNNNTWRNPLVAGNIQITSFSNPSFPLSQEQLSHLVDRTLSPNVVVTPVYNSGSHYIAIDMGAGRKLKASKVTFRHGPTSATTKMQTCRVEGFNDFTTANNLGEPTLPQTEGAWTEGTLDNTDGYRYFRIYGLDGEIENTGIWPALVLSEIEFYGELTIVPSAGNLRWTYDGDDKGVFFYLGQRGGNGTWRNPAANGDIVATADGLAFGSAEETTDRQPSNVYTDGTAGRAFYWDLKAGRSLVCNKLSYRERSQYAGVTASFDLQGRNDVDDPDDWTDLIAVHPSPIANAWTSVDVPGSIGYRQFRIISSDPYLTIGEFELYGSLDLGPPGAVVGGSITNITVLDGGENYAVAPQVVIVGDGQDAAATAVIENGVVVRIDVTNPGREYTTAEIFFLVDGGGVGAAATAILDGAVDHVEVVDGGADYTTPPTANIVGGGGTGASLAAVLGFALGAITPTAGGSGYTFADVIITPSNGATAHAVLTGDVVTDIIIDDAGVDFETPPTITIDGDGTGATADSTLAATGRVIRVDVISGGTDFQTAPSVFWTGGGGGSGVLVNTFILGPVVDFLVTNGGAEYADNPLVTLIGGGGTATAHSTVSAEGEVTDVLLDSSSADFDEPPTVSFRPAGGPVAEAIVGYGIQSVAVNTGGSNFSSPPAVHAQGDGQGAQLQAILGFPIEGVAMNSRGQNYSSTPTAVFSGGGGSGAAGTAVRGFKVASVAFSPDSTLFANDPPVVVSGGGIYGQGASFHAFVGRKLLSIDVGTPGLPTYTSDPTVVITGDGIDGAAHSVRSFALDTIGVDTGGTGFTVAPEVIVDMPTGVGGRRATAHSVLTADAVTAIVIDDPGYGYLTTPGVTIVGDGTGATATAVLLSAGVIDSIVIDDVGDGYTEVTISLTGGGGSGAAASATLDYTGTGYLVKVEIVDPGFGYTTAPTLAIAGAPSPVATLSTSGEIVAVTMTNHGSNYVTNATVTFTGGGGTGAGGTGLLDNVGRVKSITVVEQGEGFTEEPVISILGGGGTGATASASLTNGGKIKTLTLIDPGPEYSVAPLVSFVGCDGFDAAALYILATGYPVLNDIITDPTEGIIVLVEKKIVPAGTVKPPGYVDIYALDKMRSIQLTSRIDLTSLPTPEVFGQTHILNLPPLLLSVGAAYSRDTSAAIRINTGFGSASVKSSVRGKIVVHVQDGYRGPARARVVRTFMFGPPSLEQTPTPLVITPSTGTAYITSRHQARGNSIGTTGGFAYVEVSSDDSQTQDTLDISGVLTGGLAISSNSGTLLRDARPEQLLGHALAVDRGIYDNYHIGIAVAHTPVSAIADLVVSMPVSCPRSINPGNTFLLSAVVEKWRFGLYVQTLVYVTVPNDPNCTGDDGGGY